MSESEIQVIETLAEIANHLKAATAVVNSLRRHALSDVESSRSGSDAKLHATPSTVIRTADQITRFIDQAQKALSQFK
jgi:hypothetical protein